MPRSGATSALLFSIPGGDLADRYNKYDVIRITQVSLVVQSLVLAVLVLTGHAAACFFINVAASWQALSPNASVRPRPSLPDASWP